MRRPGSTALVLVPAPSTGRPAVMVAHAVPEDTALGRGGHLSGTSVASPARADE